MDEYLENLWDTVLEAENGKNNHREGLRRVPFHVDMSDFVSGAIADGCNSPMVVEDVDEALDVLSGTDIVHHYTSCACRPHIDLSTGTNASLTVRYKNGDGVLRAVTFPGVGYRVYWK